MQLLLITRIDFHIPPHSAKAMNPGALNNSGQPTTSSTQHTLSASSLSAAACLALVQHALEQARRDSRNANSDQHPGVTIDLSHQRIANIPSEVIALLKDEIERYYSSLQYMPPHLASDHC